MMVSTTNIITLFILCCFIVSSRSSSLQSPSSWVTVEGFNEEGCPESSSIGGLVIESNLCYKQQILSCSANGQSVTLTTFDTDDCSGNPTNSTIYQSGQCGDTGIWGFTKTYTCSSSRPLQPERSLVISVFDNGCQSSPQPSQLTQYRWIPTYKCMTVQRCSFYCPPLIPTSGSASASSSGTGTGTSGDNNESHKGAASFFLSKKDNGMMYKKQTSQQERLDQYWNMLDSVAGFGSAIAGDVNEESVKDNSFTVTGSGFSTGSGGSGGLPVYTNFFALALCNSTDNLIITFYNGQDMSSTAASAVSTGHYTSGDPYFTSSGGQMTSLPDPIYPSTSGGESSDQPNGCRVPLAYKNGGKNDQHCIQNQLYSVTCTPPYKQE